MMIINKCRVCGENFSLKPLLRYRKMPQAAQFFPDKKSLKSDKGINLNVYQCFGCGLVQLNSNPVSYYREVRRASGYSPEMKNFRLKQFAGFVKNYSLIGKKVIEIGCGCGEYLSLMQQCGAETYGLEYSAESVAYCVQNGLKVTKGFLQKKTDRLDSSPFDAFFILNFLEHLPNPGLTLKGISNNLTDDAVGFVEVPNFNMILRKNLFSEFIADHLFYFTKETLRETLEMSGYEIIDCQEVWHEYIISAVVKKRKRLDLSHFYKQQKKLTNELEGYLGRFKNKKVAIWGAGHQALTIISLLNFGSKIKYVVDSAPFKQGKYTPVTHFPIVSSSSLDTDPVEAIIVMGAGYSEEIVRMIQEKYDKKIKIAVLKEDRLQIIL